MIINFLQKGKIKNLLQGRKHKHHKPDPMLLTFFENKSAWTPIYYFFRTAVSLHTSVRKSPLKCLRTCILLLAHLKATVQKIIAFQTTKQCYLHSKILLQTALNSCFFFSTDRSLFCWCWWSTPGPSLGVLPPCRSRTLGSGSAGLF